MKKKILTSFCFVLIFTAFAQYPIINSGRPRIYADLNRIQWMQNNYNIPGSFKTDFENFVSAYTNNWINDPQLYLSGSDPSLWTWDWNSYWAKYQAHFTVFIYKVTKDSLYLERCKFIAQQTINTINATDFSTIPWYPKEELLRKFSEIGGLLLDWCYDDFPTILRDQLVQAMYVMNTEFMNTYILSNSGTSYVSSHNTLNNILCNQNALVLYDASGLTPEQQSTVITWYQLIYDKLINGFIPCWSYFRDDDGGWNWGAAYSMWGLGDQFQLFENMRIGTNKNFFTDLPWVQNSINQYIYFIQPDNKNLHWGDGQYPFNLGDRVVYLHSRHFNDPRSNWLAQYWSQPSNLGWTVPLFYKLLYRDYNAPIANQPSISLDWFSDKAGIAVSRSSWNNDATMVSFFNSTTKKAAHEHRDNNSFTIFKNRPLLIDAGYYDTYAGVHYLNYYERTIAHNTICVFDSTERYTSFGQPVSNDGGQIESFSLQNISDILNPLNKRGEWIKNAIGDNYHFIVSDAHQSYNPNKVDFFRRRLLYVKPNQVIVLDHLHLNNVTTAQRDVSWIAHFSVQPTISGNIINTLVPNHITTHSGRDYTAINGDGNIAIRTLLPLKTNTRRIGGDGYEYWVNGINYPPNVIPDTTTFTPGKWRIEVRPDSIPTDGNLLYLHTIDIGDNIVPSVPGGILLQNTVSVGTDWKDTIYFFSADGLIDKSYHYFDNVVGGRTVGIFASDLIMGTYYVKVDGTVVSTIDTDKNGILKTIVSLPPGNHIIEITNILLNIVEDTSVNIAIFPNPTQSELIIKTKTNFQKIHVEIFNSLGQLVLKTNDQEIIDVAGLRKGIYFVKIKIDQMTYSTKLIKQ